MRRSVFFVSESTGITAATLGNSLLSQFRGLEFRTYYMPYVDSVERARELEVRLERAKEEDGARPLVFATMPEPEVGDILEQADCFYVELFDLFIDPLARELGVAATRKSGLSHGLTNNYDSRIDSINFAMANDDGMRMDNFNQADVILIGVSRSGKTPTCLYLAMHFGLRAANYPLTEEDFERGDIPDYLLAHRNKLFGLTIDPERLHLIRQERRPNSDYASLVRCRIEVQKGRRLFERHRLPVLDTSRKSIEEISSRIVKAL